MPSSESVPLHPEATDDPETLRWVIPAEAIAVRGPVQRAPGVLGGMLDEGRIGGIVVGPGEVLITLPDSTWAADGPAVRTALSAALREPGAWSSAADVGTRSRRVSMSGDDLDAGLDADADADADADLDARLRQAVTEALEGSAGEYVRSHGGEIDLVDVRDGRVGIRLQGACAHCPAAAATLQHRVERDLRARCPGITEVHRVSA